MNFTTKVEIHTNGGKVRGVVEKRNLFEFNNGLDDSLRVRMIVGSSKDRDFYRTEVKQITSLK